MAITPKDFIDAHAASGSDWVQNHELSLTNDVALAFIQWNHGTTFFSFRGPNKTLLRPIADTRPCRHKQTKNKACHRIVVKARPCERFPSPGRSPAPSPSRRPSPRDRLHHSSMFAVYRSTYSTNLGSADHTNFVNIAGTNSLAAGQSESTEHDLMGI